MSLCVFWISNGYNKINTDIINPVGYTNCKPVTADNYHLRLKTLTRREETCIFIKFLFALLKAKKDTSEICILHLLFAFGSRKIQHIIEWNSSAVKSLPRCRFFGLTIFLWTFQKKTFCNPLLKGMTHSFWTFLALC